MKFTEYVEDKDDHIRQYVAYLARKHDVSLEEAARRSLGRMWKLIHEGTDNYVIITAFRGERTLSQNRAANLALMADLRDFEWGYTPVLGGFREKVRDASGDPTGEERDVDEESFFATSTDDKETFRKRVMELVDKYDQESALVKYADDPNPDAYFLTAAGAESRAGRWAANRMAQYYTKMKMGPADRKAAFEAVDDFTFIAAGDLSRTTRMLLDNFRETHA